MKPIGSLVAARSFFPAQSRQEPAKKRAVPVVAALQHIGITLACLAGVGTSTFLDERPLVTVRRAPDDGPALVSVPGTGVNVAAVERALIVFALQATGGNRTHAARFLGLTRSALLYRMRKHGLVG